MLRQQTGREHAPAGRLALVFMLALLLALFLAVWIARSPEPAPIRIGVIHSLTGTMGAEEAPLVDAIRLAVEETNAAGGLLGRPVELRVVDARSDDARVVTEAERLIRDEQVSVLFACWTSSCRKAIRPVVEKYRHLLLYSLQYEGLEQSPDIFYTGATAGQQVIPGVQWALGRFGRRVLVVGSDYVFPHVAATMMKDALAAVGETLLAEHYHPLGASDFSGVASDIVRLQPDAVVNLVNGDSNRHLFRALHDAGIRNIPVISFSVTENGLRDIGRDYFYPQHYAVWNYLGSLPTDDSQQFVSKLQSRFGPQLLATDPVESSYVAFRLWAQAVRHAGSDQPSLVKHALLQESMAAPSGIAAFDRVTQHLWKKVYVGKALADYSFAIEWQSGDAFRPEPFPAYRTRYEWQEILRNLESRLAEEARQP